MVNATIFYFVQSIDARCFIFASSNHKAVIHTTRGIVLNHHKYAETSIIVTIYTELFGRQAYIVNGVRSAKSKGKTVFLQPLALLDLQVYHNPKKEIQRIKDFKVAVPFVSIPFDQTKRSIAFFVTEVMTRSLREEIANSAMFHFIFESVAGFDAEPKLMHEFHLHFMAKLTQYLGFSPDFSSQTMHGLFDLQHGVMSEGDSVQYHLPGSLLPAWKNLFTSESWHATVTNADNRNLLIDYLLQYYRLHLEGFGQLKSLDVLTSLYR